MPVIPSRYVRPPRHQFNAHLQTILPSMLRKVPGVTYERERIDTPDGDFLDLDWLVGKHRRLVLLTHGLEGDSGRHYIRGTAKLFFEHGYDALAWNCRSCSGEMNRAFRLYNHGEIGDIGHVLNHALQRKSYDNVVMVGYSMGGNITLKYLGANANDVPDVVSRGVAVSSPLDLVSSAGLLDLPANRFYRQRFMGKLIRKMQLKAQMHPGQLDLSKLRSVQIWKDFDDAFSAPINGYRDADDFYEQASAIHYVAGTTRPVLVLNAQNDPLLTPSCAPAWLAEQHPLIYVETPRLGGHVGFMQPNDPHTYAERQALAFAEDKL